MAALRAADGLLARPWRRHPPAPPKPGCRPVHGAPAAADWGVDGAEQLAAGFRSAYENTPMTARGVQGVRQLKSGFKFHLAVMGDCTVQAWGTNNKAELGDGTQQARNHPVPVVGLTDVKEVAVGNAHAMALLYDGTVWTWGAAEFGERGTAKRASNVWPATPNRGSCRGTADPGAGAHRRQADRVRRHA